MVYLALDVGVGLCPLPLSAWGPGLASHQPDTQMPFRVGAGAAGVTGSPQGVESRIMPRTHITGSVPAENPPVQGRGPWAAGGLGGTLGTGRRGQPVGSTLRLILSPAPPPSWLAVFAPHQTSHL